MGVAGARARNRHWWSREVNGSDRRWTSSPTSYARSRIPRLASRRRPPTRSLEVVGATSACAVAASPISLALCRRLRAAAQLIETIVTLFALPFINTCHFFSSQQFTRLSFVYQPLRLNRRSARQAPGFVVFAYAYHPVCHHVNRALGHAWRRFVLRLPQNQWPLA